MDQPLGSIKVLPEVPGQGQSSVLRPPEIGLKVPICISFCEDLRAEQTSSALCHSVPVPNVRLNPAWAQTSNCDLIENNKCLMA